MSVEDIQKCIDRGDDLYQTHENTIYVNPYVYHCFYGNTDIIKYLVDVCADNVNHEMFTDLGFDLVCAEGHVDLFDYLVSRGTFKIKSITGVTPLAFAAYKGQLDIVIRLLPLMSIDQINSKNTSGMTCVHMAIEGLSLDILKHLTIYGADLNVADNNGITPLMLAKQLGHNHIVEYLSYYVSV